VRRGGKITQGSAAGTVSRSTGMLLRSGQNRINELMKGEVRNIQNMDNSKYSASIAAWTDVKGTGL